MHGILPPPVLPSVNSTLQQLLIAGAAAEATENVASAEVAAGVEMGLDVGTDDAAATATAATVGTTGVEEPESSNGLELGGAMMPPKQKRSSSASYPSLASNSGSLL